jgi:hypothetical protein
VGVPASWSEFGEVLGSADERVLWAIVAATVLMLGVGAFAGWRDRRG